MKIVPLSKVINDAGSWRGSTAKYVREVLGLKLYPYQELLLDVMDIRNRFNRRFRPDVYRRQLMAGSSRGMRSNVLICDDLNIDTK